MEQEVKAVCFRVPKGTGGAEFPSLWPSPTTLIVDAPLTVLALCVGLLSRVWLSIPLGALGTLIHYFS